MGLVKIWAIKECPIPTNKQEVRGFLGLISYFKIFMQNYGYVVAPLTQLLKLWAYKWLEEAQLAFEKLKTAMMTLPILALPDFNLCFEIETEAFGYGVCVVLIQVRRPIA